MKNMLHIWQIKLVAFVLHWILRAESMEVMRTMSCKVIWDKCEPVEPEEVDRAASATCVSDLCPSWLMKASWEVMD